MGRILVVRGVGLSMGSLRSWVKYQYGKEWGMWGSNEEVC